MKWNQSEWQVIDELAIDYHQRQWNAPYRSTGKFIEFVAQVTGKSKSIIDLGCGGGAATYALASKYKDIQFLGLDLSKQLVDFATIQAAKRGRTNLRFECDDWFDLKERADVDGVVSLQTISWLPEWKEPLRQVFQRIDCSWIALSSLFYDGDISCQIKVTEHARRRECFYNIYSINQISVFANEFGYSLARYEPVEMDIDLPAPANKDLMGTYTVRVDSQRADLVKRLQISGPLLMNWGFVLLLKT